MQIFCLSEDITGTFMMLDAKRANKQLVEVITILRGNWKDNHPIVKAYAIYEKFLRIYFVEGFNVSPYEYPEGSKMHKNYLEIARGLTYENVRRPWWWGHPFLINNHLTNLTWKDPDFYAGLHQFELPMVKPRNLYPTQEKNSWKIYSDGVFLGTFVVQDESGLGVPYFDTLVSLGVCMPAKSVAMDHWNSRISPN